METIERIDPLRDRLGKLRRDGARIGFVPTMGALHEGHLSLVRLARTRSDRVVMSIFVNPTQFGPAEDLALYPRDLERDRGLAAAAGVDFLFVPDVGEVYPPGFSTFVRVEGLEDRLCGASRPGHFRGVATVVARLLGVVAPDLLVLGQKDAQQLALLRRMVHDLALPVQVIGAPIVREADGLAMSSRNAYLDPAGRRAAGVLHRALARAVAAHRLGERSAAALAAAIRDEVAAEPGARLDYAAVVDPDTLVPLERVEGPALAALAAFVGRTRLIDNEILGAGPAPRV